jgi:O-antigen ligase
MQVSSTVDKAGYVLLTACVVGAPVPFGATGGLSGAVLGFLLGLCLLGTVAIGAHSRLARRLLTATSVIALVIAAVSLVHVLPWGGVSIAGSKGLAVVGDAATVPASRFQPLHATGYVLIPLAAFMCALVYVSDDRRYVRFVQTAIGASALVTAASLLQHAAWPHMLLWTRKSHYLDAFTGTFVNPNTAATYYGTLLLVSLSFALRQAERAGVGSVFLTPAPQAYARQQHDLRMLLAYAGTACLFAVALALTKSRAGILSSFVAVAIFVAAYTYLSVRRSGSQVRAIAAGAGAMLIAAGLFLAFGERVLLRLHTQGLLEQGRLCTYDATWKAIKDSSWWGTGLGTFQDVFPAYRVPACGLSGHWEMAHSVFLEGWLSLGVVFLACTAVAYFGLIRVYGRGLLERQRYRFVPLAALCLLLLLTLHSLVDFSLQVPGVAVVAAALLGAGAAVASRERGAGSRAG